MAGILLSKGLRKNHHHDTKKNKTRYSAGGKDKKQEEQLPLETLPFLDEATTSSLAGNKYGTIQ